LARYNPHRDAQPVHKAAETWSARCLIADRSVFLDDRNLWTPELLDELDRRFVQNLDEGEGDFFEKLEAQLKDGSAECHQLMAEVIWIIMLFQARITPGRKRESVRRIWSWSGAELSSDNALLADEVLIGLGSAGTAYNTHRWREVVFLIGAAREFKRRNRESRESLLQDGWAFAEWLWSQPGAANRQLPHILSHLLFPDLFERISSGRDKRLILAAFDETPEKELRRWNAVKIDRALLELRRRFEANRGGPIDFYDDEFANDWRTSVRTWLLSWNPQNWEWSSLQEDRARTQAGETVSLPWRCSSTAPREGDHVYLARVGVDPRGVVAFGTIARASYEAPHYDPAKAEQGETSRSIDAEFNDIRDAEHDPIVSLAELQRQAPDQTWTPQSSGIEVKPNAAHVLARLWAGGRREPAAAASPPITPITIDAGEPLNLLLYGPPGTGKTYRVQQHYMPLYREGDTSRHEFVTFHQSYSYEDFIEGIRPIMVSGVISYEVRPGVLRRLCERARNDLGHRYALFIDEINRGNIPKIFGELITLIETDKRARYDEHGRMVSGLEITLPYSGERFSVPANLDLIGTMNTADRSIALLDTALRRRFQFEELLPVPGAIKGAADGLILDDEGGDVDLRKLLSVLNQRLAHLLHRDQTIGHAVFTKVRDFAGLRRVIAREIIPLLQEYFYDDWGQIRLVLGDHSVGREYQIVRQTTVGPDQLFSGAELADIGEGHLFDIAPEAEISADAIRKIYEL
jgi:5-methylcytosine-specific restriction protein B